MNIEQVYAQVKQTQYLPGSIRWRVGSFNEYPDLTDTTKFVTPEGQVFVIEYRTFDESNRTLTDVYDIIPVDPAESIIKG